MEITKIGMLIYVVRGQRVMMDRDLAALYGVKTGALNQAVSRNMERFPEHFMFQLTAKETENWISQIVISNSGLKMGQRKRPYAFTEQGVSSLSAVLRSKRAIRVYIEIIDAFVSMRRVLGNNKKLAQRMEKAEEQLSRHEGEINTLFEDIEALSNPSTGPKRSIGFSGA
ncbi:MAG: ORF6N domain-containing protein [Elusimicrobia bacterium]|nr:ORF6N domain-containing protein [Elusimicrobiota bacterium]